ncbi:MAG TPA: hypothetical protein VGF48_24915 [Thermoanaerobaculia bacterium]
MSNQKNAPVSETATPSPSSHTDAAQARVEELRAMRLLIPFFTVPPDRIGRRRLTSKTSLPPEFVELTVVATSNHDALVLKRALTPAERRELQTYGEAYSPVADELEALAQFVRYSIAAAKARAGEDALDTYALAQRLAKRPEHADLAPHVADMRRALGNRGKRKAQQPDAKK